jgi:predicted anti-sigma-YlaC factor YlaD
MVRMTMPWPAELPNRAPSSRHLRALVSCEAVAEELPLVVDGARRPSASMAEHLQTCLVCQAEVAGYRRLLRALRGMRESQVPLPSAELVGSALSMLHQHPLWGRRRSQTPWLVVGVLGVVGVAALSAGALARSGRRSPFNAAT